MNEQQTVTNAPASPPRQPQQKKGPKGLWAFGLIVGAGIAFGGAVFFDVFPSFSGTNGDEVATMDPESIVATVNNISVTRAELAKKVDELKASFPQGAVDATQDAAFELQVLDEVINMKILTAEAGAQGITITDEDVDAEMTALTESLGGEENLLSELSAVGLTKDGLRENMKNELALRTLFENNTTMKDVQVSDEEVRAMYDEAVAQSPEGQDIPPFAEVSEMARAQLVQQKSGELIQAYIATLREKATIEVLL